MQALSTQTHNSQKKLPVGELVGKLEPLRNLAERIATVSSMEDPFFNCLASSFTKAFEFTDMASKQEPAGAFFLVPALRAITEDIIYLCFLSPFPLEIRKQVVADMQLLNLSKKIRQQNAFFEIFRPFQPALPPIDFDEEEIGNRLRSFWRENGWPRLHDREVPPVRQIAQKSDPELLQAVYDFIYRLTSNTVHFDPQELLRTGWGNLKGHMVFCSGHMGPYYLAVNRIYGSYLLCLYFELFDQFLKPNPEETNAVVELRRYLLDIPRWPEMITFEEMGVPVTHPGEELLKRGKFGRIATIHLIEKKLRDTIAEKGFISETEKMLDSRKTEKSAKK